MSPVIFLYDFNKISTKVKKYDKNDLLWLFSVHL